MHDYLPLGFLWGPIHSVPYAEERDPWAHRRGRGKSNGWKTHQRKVIAKRRAASKRSRAARMKGL